ncbi:fatty acid desaturase [Yoonia sp. 208BN28-4]|uniref:fatty acid desaturase n=1 Tax=Yoonia sp. 208BN28-4 TaxID=3126505 RepID=UPI0030B79578
MLKQSSTQVSDLQAALDHKAFLRSLTAEQRAVLTAKQDCAGYIHLAGHLGALALSGTYIALGLPLWWLMMLPHGMMLVLLFTLLHETSHDTVFASLRANRIVAAFCGVVLLIPPVWFKYFHLAHHRHTHDPDADPELETPKPETWRAYLWHLTGLPTWRAKVATLLANAQGKASAAYIPERKRGQVRQEAYVMLAFYATVLLLAFATSATWILTLWIIPALLGEPALRFYLMAEHGRCPHAANMFENTRTTLTNRIVRFFAWNMPYHAEHHAFPTVPFHKLPQLHDLTQAHLQQVSQGYRAFHRNYAADLTR